MDERLQSRVIDYLRFPMAVLVVLCHCKTLFGIGGGPAPAGQSIQVFLAEVLPHIAVPVFVFFSGFLFFYKTDFCLKVYAEKIRRRTKSLLIPYLIWCAFGYVLAALQGQCSWTLRNFIFGFWDTTAWMELPSHIHAAFPADMPLWFVRDLMVVTMLAPAIHWCIKHTGILLPAATGIWWFSHWYANIPGLGSQIVFFFILGAWFSIKGWDFVEKTRNLRLPLWIVAGGLMTADFIVLNNRFQASGELQYCWPLFNAYVLFGVFAVIQLVSALLEGNARKASRFWTTGCFFLYAVHFLYSPNLMVAMGNIWYPSTAGGHLLFYLSFCSLTIALAIGLYYILYRFAPKITSTLVGGRLVPKK